MPDATGGNPAAPGTPLPPPPKFFLAILVQDIYDFLQTYLHEDHYDRLLALIDEQTDFYLSFPLVEKINDINNVIIFRREGRFAIQFIPEHIDVRPDADSIAPDVVVFVTK